MSFLFDRGYTGHEHLDKFSLINMNGRVYDPWLGRFLSPDPFVQVAGYSQNYNRYSYALNNPLKYTDPSGYHFHPSDFNNSGSGGVIVSSFGPGYKGGLANWTNADNYFGWADLYYNDVTNTSYGEYSNSGGQFALNGSNVITVSGESVGDLYENLIAGFNLYTVTAFGNTTLVSSFGDIGGISYGTGGGIQFKDNKTAAAYAGEVSVAAGQGGSYANEGITLQEAVTGVGAFGLANSIKGNLVEWGMKGADWGLAGARYVKYVKGLGYVGAGLTTTYSVSSAYNYYNNGGSNWSVYAKSGLDIIMTGASFFWPIGTAVSGAYFILDVSTDSFGGFGEIKP